MVLRKLSVAIAATVLAIAGFLAGCGDGDSGPEAQPAQDEAGFDEGVFGDLPLYPRSTALGEVARTDDTVSRSYRAAGASPAMVLEFYEDSLVDWEVVKAPEQIGAASTMRGVWRDGSLELTVSATEGPTVPQDDGATGGNPEASQYSLSLRDVG